MKEARKKLLALGYGKPDGSFRNVNDESDIEQEKQNRDIHSSYYKQLNPINLVKLYNQEGLIRVSLPENNKVKIYRNENNVLRPFNHETDTISLLMHHNNYPKEELSYRRFLLTKERDIINSYKQLPPIIPNWQKDTKHAIHNSFKNGVAKVTKDGYTMLDYSSDELGFFSELTC